MSPLERAVEIAGWGPLADECGVTHQAIRKWIQAGRLPRSEFSGETTYASDIERATNGQVSAKTLLRWSREGWKKAA